MELTDTLIYYSSHQVSIFGCFNFHILLKLILKAIYFANVNMLKIITFL